MKSTIQIIGVPLDLGASRRGTDAGPSAVRIAGLSGALKKLGYILEREIDIPVPGIESRDPQQESAKYKKEILAVCETLCAQTAQALARDQVPLIIGGDHSIAMGTVSGVAQHFRKSDQNIGVLWFDAHGDMNEPDSSPSGNVHGMPLAHLLGRGDFGLASLGGVTPAIRPEHVALVGIRDIDETERRLIRDSGIHVFTMRDIDEIGMAEVCRQALRVVTDGTAGFHLSFDVDGCDPEVMPGSGTLVPGGVTFREAHQLLENCAESGKMVSMEVVELNPFLDQGNVSAERAVMLIQSAFGRSIL
ncbi:MAG: arginase [Pseudomonadota bacterium]